MTDELKTNIFQLPPKRRNGFCFVECVWQPAPGSGRSTAELTCA